MPVPTQDELLRRHLEGLLGGLDAEAMAELEQQLEWVTLIAGETLMTQGEPGDAMYLSISGRLRAYVRDDDGREHLVREMARGQVVGEMALYTGEPRSATVVAIRDSVLVRLGREGFERLLARSPRLSMALTRQLIWRLQNPQPRSDLERPVTIGLLPASPGVDLPSFAHALAQQLQRHGRVCVVDVAALDAALQQPGIARSDGSSGSTAGAGRTGEPGGPGSGAGAADADRRIAIHLDEVEAAHDYVLLLADDDPGAWTRRVTRRSDELLLLADADAAPELHAVERECLLHRPGRAEAAETLVLLHPADRRCPQGTRRWLARRPVQGHLHVRPALARDMARLARLLSGTAVGLVFAGGGARGLAHLGVMQSLQAHGIEVDAVGGTSIGATMAVLAACDQPLEQVLPVARRAFRTNPTGDYNWLPMLSLIAGRRLRRVVGQALRELAGAEIDAEDLWKPWFGVATNFTQSREEVIDHGPLLQAVLASVAIPGALPPVLRDGELLCDGGSFNNFPVDVMRGRRGIGRVIGVDLGPPPPRRIEHETLPGTWALLRDRLRPRARRRWRLPSLVSYLLTVTVLYSQSRRRIAQRQTDLYFSPSLPRVGMLQWERFDTIVEQGRTHADEVLGALSPAMLARYADGVPAPPASELATAAGADAGADASAETDASADAPAASAVRAVAAKAGF